MSTPDPKPPADQPVVVLSPSALLLVAVAAVFFAVGLIAGVLLTRQNSTDTTQIEIILRRVLADLELQRPTDRFELVGNDPYLGPEDAPVVIVEFSAYGCPYCKQFHDTTLPSILENYGDVVRYVYRDMPTVNPEVSFPAAMAAHCAEDQGKFWEYHSALFEFQLELNDERLSAIATELEMDVNVFDACMTSNKYYDEVNGDFFDGTMAGVSTTPNFFINGTLYTGAQPFSFFQDVIERELFKAGVQRGGS